jgi:hypothetical protein
MEAEDLSETLAAIYTPSESHRVKSDVTRRTKPVQGCNIYVPIHNMDISLIGLLIYLTNDMFTEYSSERSTISSPVYIFHRQQFHWSPNITASGGHSELGSTEFAH